jgi:hypothetical protein
MIIKLNHNHLFRKRDKEGRKSLIGGRRQHIYVPASAASSSSLKRRARGDIWYFKHISSTNKQIR